MQIVHISDTHTKQGRENLIIPPCDVLAFSGDMGGRTSLEEFKDFLEWMEAQPAELKILVGGNHDYILSKEPGARCLAEGNVFGQLRYAEEYRGARALLETSSVKYLENKEYVWKGVKFYGSPYSPSFHRDHWVFNADRGDQIRQQWAKIPSDVNVLITHTPVYGMLDEIPENYKRWADEDVHVGCEDLLNVIRKRLFQLKLHMSGHIHSQYGCILAPISKTRNVLFSNGAVLTNDYTQLVTNPLVITI